MPKSLSECKICNKIIETANNVEVKERSLSYEN